MPGNITFIWKTTSEAVVFSSNNNVSTSPGSSIHKLEGNQRPQNQKSGTGRLSGAANENTKSAGRANLKHHRSGQSAASNSHQAPKVSVIYRDQLVNHVRQNWDTFTASKQGLFRKIIEPDTANLEASKSAQVPAQVKKLEELVGPLVYKRLRGNSLRQAKLDSLKSGVIKMRGKAARAQKDVESVKRNVAAVTRLSDTTGKFATTRKFSNYPVKIETAHQPKQFLKDNSTDKPEQHSQASTSAPAKTPGYNFGITPHTEAKKNAQELANDILLANYRDNLMKHVAEKIAENPDAFTQEQKDQFKNIENSLTRLGDKGFIAKEGGSEKNILLQTKTQKDQLESFVPSKEVRDMLLKEALKEPTEMMKEINFGPEQPDNRTTLEKLFSSFYKKIAAQLSYIQKFFNFTGRNSPADAPVQFPKSDTTPKPTLKPEDISLSNVDKNHGLGADAETVNVSKENYEEWEKFNNNIEEEIIDYLERINVDDQDMIDKLFDENEEIMQTLSQATSETEFDMEDLLQAEFDKDLTDSSQPNFLNALNPLSGDNSTSENTTDLETRLQKLQET